MADDAHNEENAREERYRLSPIWKLFAAGSVFLLVTIAVGAYAELPMYSIQPGPARDVTKLVSVRGQPTYANRGAFLLTTVAVSAQPVSLFEGFASMFDPATALVGRSAIVGPGLTDREQDELNLAEMLQSKYAAAVVALRALRRPIPQIPGARVVYVYSGSASSGKLKAGDVITAIDGVAVANVQGVTERIRTHEPGEDVAVTVSRADGLHRFDLTTKRAVDDAGKARPVIGVSLAPAFRFPVDVQIDTQDIGGPSGGLVFSLAIVEVLGEEDLTKGHVVAATGTIDLEGRVGEIGGVEQKVRAAERSGADVFFVPYDEANEAQRVAQTVKVVGVRTLEEALGVLRGFPPAGRNAA